MYVLKYRRLKFLFYKMLFKRFPCDIHTECIDKVLQTLIAPEEYRLRALLLLIEMAKLSCFYQHLEFLKQKTEQLQKEL